MLSQLSDNTPANTEAELYRHDSRLKRQTLNPALGKFNISTEYADSCIIKHKANKVYTNLNVESDGLTYIQKIFASNLINAKDTQINRIKAPCTCLELPLSGV